MRWLALVACLVVASVASAEPIAVGGTTFDVTPVGEDFVALDLSTGEVYWIDSGPTPQIRSLGQSGSWLLQGSGGAYWQQPLDMPRSGGFQPQMLFPGGLFKPAHFD